ncbi:Na+/H+ antiporter [soil metagenome]
MDNFVVIIFIITTLIILSAFSNKIKLPYPILLLAVGIAIGFVPFIPSVELDPEIVFLIFLPPILYDASLKTSWLEFKREIRPISTLAISLVFCTTIAVAFAAHYFIPGFSWPMAFVLGAIVSPPDAVAATSITKGMGLNRRVITIIEGESLVNDASALIAYRYAVAAVFTGTFIFWKALLGFLQVGVGGVLAGLSVGFIMVFAHKKITDNPIVETTLSLLTPFIAYIVAEGLHSSGVLAVVTAGFFISWHSREIMTFQTRLQNNVVWETVIFVLNGLVFIFMGLQIPAVIGRFKEHGFFPMLAYGLIISVVTILIRIIWVFIGAYHPRIFKRKRNKPGADVDEEPVSWKNVLLVGWTGTRGVVSLATALALPLFLSNGLPFPLRDHILFFTFVVILITLVVQGSTLPLLVRTLGIKRETHLQKREDKDLQLMLTENVLQFITSDFPIELDDKVMEQIRKGYQSSFNLLSKNKSVGRYENQNDVAQINLLRQMMSGQLEIIKYKRELLLKFQKEGTFNEESIGKAELELDIEELRISNMKLKREVL